MTRCSRTPSQARPIRNRKRNLLRTRRLNISLSPSNLRDSLNQIALSANNNKGNDFRDNGRVITNTRQPIHSSLADSSPDRPLFTMLPRSPHRLQLQVIIRCFFYNRFTNNVRPRIREHKPQMYRSAISLISLRQQGSRIRRRNISLASTRYIRRLIRLIMTSLLRLRTIARPYRSTNHISSHLQITIRTSSTHYKRSYRRHLTIAARTNHNVSRR